jgi:hypothetical protein
MPDVEVVAPATLRERMLEGNRCQREAGLRLLRRHRLEAGRFRLSLPTPIARPGNARLGQAPVHLKSRKQKAKSRNPSAACSLVSDFSFLISGFCFSP